MIELHKMIAGKYDSNVCIKFDRNIASVTRGNSVKLQHKHVRYDLRKYFFSNRVVAKWNSLPNTVIQASSTNMFKNILDGHWKNQEVLFDWRAHLTGIKDRSNLL